MDKKNSSFPDNSQSCKIHIGRLLAKVVILMAMVFSGVSSAFAQQEIKGTVIDNENEPVIGASVFVKGSKSGTMTNIDGAFTLNAKPSDTIVISFIGYKPVEVKVGKRTDINVTLQPDSELLDEVVVVGYGTVKKKDLTGSVSNLKGELVTDRHTTQLTNALQGAMAGVQVTRSNGQPGATGSVLIRGVTTIKDQGPLIIVDGIPVDNMDDVNANDVENITVLKDAASASIYGSRAASGVILITTKRADESKMNITYNFEYGLEIPTSQPKQVKFQRYLEMVNELKYNDNPVGGWYQEYSQDQVENWLARNPEDPDNYPVTDWYKLMVKGSAPRQSHIVNLTGGSQKVKTRATLSYDKTEGLFKEAENRYERFMFRVNNDYIFNKYVSAHIDVNVKHSETTKPEFTSVWTAIFNYSPAYQPVWTNGGMGDVKSGSNPYGRLVKGGDIKGRTTKVGGKASIDITPIKGLKLQAIFAPNLTYASTKTFQKAVPYNPQDDPTFISGYLSDHDNTNLKEERANSRSMTSQALATYIRKFGKHDLNVMAGFESYYYYHESIGASSSHFELDGYPYLDAGNKQYLGADGTAYENAYMSYFGRIMYNYADKYLLQFNIRHDGSSRFHKDYRWGTFPSVSAGWVMSQEKFMSEIDTKALSFLKLRASWGRLGNERIGNYPYISLMDFTSALMYGGMDITSPTFYKGAAQIQYAMRNISWETTESFDFGLDARFLNNRLSLGFDWYRKNTKDMLLELEIPKYVGYANPEQNAGRMSTHGYDIELGWNDRIGEVSYSVGINFSDYVSKMKDLRGKVFTGDKVRMTGSYYDEWYGYVAEGLFQTQEEVDNSPVINNTTKVGDIKYRDISGPDGVPDGKISEYDKVLLGNSLPRYLYGGNVQVNWRGFDFGFAFQGVGKQNVRMTDAMVQPFKNNWGAIPGILDGNYFSELNTEQENLNAKYPRLTYINRESNNAMSTFWMFNGRYFRMKNMTLGYTLPKSLTKKAFVERLRFYVTGNDLFCFHNYPEGYDPERTYNQYPITKSVVFGFNINF